MEYFEYENYTLHNFYKIVSSFTDGQLLIVSVSQPIHVQHWAPWNHDGEVFSHSHKCLPIEFWGLWNNEYKSPKVPYPSISLVDFICNNFLHRDLSRKRGICFAFLPIQIESLRILWHLWRHSGDDANSKNGTWIACAGRRVSQNWSTEGYVSKVWGSYWVNWRHSNFS